jgi:assimilatory nitrate reductase catalytic subunit
MHVEAHSRGVSGSIGPTVQPTPRFLQAIRPFEGRGLDEYVALDPPLSYRVPAGREAQCVYFRGGNSTSELVCVVLTRDGAPMRLFPIGARSSLHIPLRITESLLTDTELELHVAAPSGVRGTVVVDLGILEL